MSPFRGRAGRNGYRPWVCCTKCGSRSWVYLDRAADCCERCGEAWPAAWPPLPGAQPAASPKPLPPQWQGKDSRATTLKYLEEDPAFAELLGLKKEVVAKVASGLAEKKPAGRAAVSQHQQTVCKLAKERDRILREKEQMPVRIQKLLAAIKELNKRDKELDDQLVEAEKSLADARLAATNALADIALPDARPAVVKRQEEIDALLCRLEELRKTLADEQAAAAAAAAEQATKEEAEKQAKEKEDEAQRLAAQPSQAGGASEQPAASSQQQRQSSAAQAEGGDEAMEESRKREAEEASQDPGGRAKKAKEARSEADDAVAAAEKLAQEVLARQPRL